MEYKHSEYATILIFLPLFLYLIIHNLKIRRYSSADFKNVINGIFSGFMSTLLAAIFAFFRPIIWKSRIISYIETFLIFIMIGILIFFTAKAIIKNIIFLKNLCVKVLETKINIIESVLMTILVMAVFIYDNIWIWFITFVVLLVLLVKEAFLMSELYKELKH